MNMNKTIAAYLSLALTVSILSIASVIVSVEATLDLLGGETTLFSSIARTLGGLLAVIGVSIALPLNHANFGVRVLQAYLYPVIIWIVSAVVSQHFIGSHLTNIGIQVSSMCGLAAASGMFGFLIRPWLSRYFTDLPRWVHRVDAGRQVVTVVIVIFGLAFRLYARTAM